MFRIHAAVMVAFASISSAHAGVLASHLSFDGTPDVLNGDSVSFVVDVDGDSAFSVGDIVSGVSRIGSTTTSGILAPDDQLIGLFSFRITSSVGVAGGDPTVTSGSGGVDPLAGTGFSIDELLGVPTGTFGSSAAVAVLSSNSNVDITTLPAADLPAALASYQLQAVLGFGSAADYFEIQSFRDFDDSGEIDFTELPSGSGFFASENGGLSVLSHNLGSAIFLPVASTHADGTTNTTHDVAISGALFGRQFDTPDGYAITNSTNLAINAVPEPGSMAIWGLLVGAGVVTARRRNKK